MRIRRPSGPTRHRSPEATPPANPASAGNGTRGVDETKPERAVAESGTEARRAERARELLGAPRPQVPTADAPAPVATHPRLRVFERAAKLDVDESRVDDLLSKARGTLGSTGKSGETDSPLAGDTPSEPVIEDVTKEKTFGDGDLRGSVKGTVGLDVAEIEANVDLDRESDAGRTTGSLDGKVDATPEGVRVDVSGEGRGSYTIGDGTAVESGGRGGLRIDEQGTVGLDASLSGSVTDRGGRSDGRLDADVVDGGVRLDGGLSRERTLDDGSAKTTVDGGLDLEGGHGSLGVGHSRVSTNGAGEGRVVVDVSDDGVRVDAGYRRDQQLEDGTRTVHVDGTVSNDDIRIDAGYQRDQVVEDGSRTIRVDGEVSKDGVRVDAGYQRDQVLDDGARRTTVNGTVTQDGVQVDAGYQRDQVLEDGGRTIRVDGTVSKDGVQVDAGYQRDKTHEDGTSRTTVNGTVSKDGVRVDAGYQRDQVLDDGSRGTTVNGTVSKDGVQVDAGYQRDKTHDDGTSRTTVGGSASKDGIRVDAGYQRDKTHEDGTSRTTVGGSVSKDGVQVGGGYQRDQVLDDGTRTIVVDGSVSKDGVRVDGSYQRDQVLDDGGRTIRVDGSVSKDGVQVDAGYQRDQVLEDGTRKTTVGGTVSKDGVQVDGSYQRDQVLDDGTRKTTVNGTVSKDGVQVDAGYQRDKTHDDGTSRTTVAGNGSKDGVDIDVSYQREQELEDGTRSIQVGGTASKDGVQLDAEYERARRVGDGTRTTRVDGDFDLRRGQAGVDASHTYVSERTLEDGTRLREERGRGVHGSLVDRDVEVRYSERRVSEKDSVRRSTDSEIRLGMKGAELAHQSELDDANTGASERLGVQGSLDSDGLKIESEHVRVAREGEPGGPVRDVERGTRGQVHVHRRGGAIEVSQHVDDGAGGAKTRGGSASYDATGLNVSLERGRMDADGNARSGEAGLRAAKDSAGLTWAHSSSELLSESETRSSARAFDLMVGNRKASGSWQSSRTRTTLGDDGQTSRASRYARLSGGVEAFREVDDKGPVESDDPALVGKHLVEVHRRVDAEGGASVGLLTGTVGLFGGLTLQRGSDIRYRTHVAPDEAAKMAASSEGGGLLSPAKRYVVGASLVAGDVAVPDLSRPDTLRVHDEVELSTSGSLRVHAGIEAYGGRAGAEIVASGDFTLHVRKTAETTVEVDVTPTKIRGIEGEASLLLFEGRAGHTRAQTLSQRFSFDLATESGQLAYQRMLEGKLPGTLSARDVSAKEDALDKLRQSDLPEGVTRLRVEKVEVKESSRSARAGWMFLSASRAKTSRTTEQVVTDGEVSVNRRARSIERHRKTLLSGTEREGVSGSLRVVTAFDEKGAKIARFDGFSLSAHWSDDKVKGHELNQDVVAEVNRAFGIGLSPFEQKGIKEAREVSVEATLDAPDLDALARAPATKAREVAVTTGASEKATTKLLEEMAATKDVLARAHLVERYVAKEGVAGMGAVLELAGRTAGLSLSTTSSAYDTPLADAKTYASRYAKGAFRASMSKAEITERYEELRGTAERLEDAVLRADDDPFLGLRPDVRDALKQEMNEARDAVEALLDFSTLSHEDAVTLYGTLDRGWTSSRQAQAMQEIAREAGLLEVDTGFRSARITSEREADGARVRTASVAKQSWFPALGDERSQVSASTRTERAPDGSSRVAGMTLRVALSDEKSRFDEINRGPVRDLNRAFGLSLKGVEHGDGLGGTARSVTVTRELSATDLERLGSLNDADIARASEGSPDPARVRKLAKELRAAKDLAARAEVIERHVKAHGLFGAGDLHRLSGGAASDVEVRSATDAYGKRIDEALEVAARYARPVSRETPSGEIASRFDDVREAYDKLDDAERRLAGDHLLDKGARQAERDRIAMARAELAAVLDMRHLSHDDAALLVGRLESGWVGRGEEEAAKAIREGAGLLDVREHGRTRIAHAVREHSGVRTETRSRVEQPWLSSGEERVRVEASRQEGEGAVRLSAVFSDSDERSGELSEEVISRLNRSFGTAYASGPSRSDGGERRVEVALSLDEARLSHLASANTDTTRKLGRRIGVPSGEVERFLGELAGAKSAAERAASVMRFVERTGVEGMGLVHRLSGGGSLDVESSTTAHAATLREVDGVLSVHGGSELLGEMTNQELVARSRALEDARERLTTTRKRIDADPLLSADLRASLVEEIAIREAALEQALAFSGVDKGVRERLIANLEKGWTTREERALIERLRDEA